MTLSLQEKLELLIARTRFCPVCGGLLSRIGRYSKQCGLRCGVISFSDGDCSDSVTACFEPNENLFVHPDAS